MLGLSEIYYAAEEQAVGYRVGSTQITISQHPAARPADGWSTQLGWEGGTTAETSWGFHLEPEPFRDAVGRLRDCGAAVWQADPAWVGYWSFPVRDPMGNTVEISASDVSAWA